MCEVCKTHLKALRRRNVVALGSFAINDGGYQSVAVLGHFCSEPHLDSGSFICGWDVDDGQSEYYFLFVAI
ncbi:MAG TPA: hypothetical protein VJB99_00230 [Patescibacteria group bacterium]|nr:hypothetical protein [Patescibacteria group bacterium]